LFDPRVKHLFAGHVFDLRVDVERLFGYNCSSYRCSTNTGSFDSIRRNSWESFDMSATLSIHPPSHVPVRDRSTTTTPATYRRRRAFLGTVLAVLVACGAVLTNDVLAGSGGVPASAAAGPPAHIRTTITAQPGDTLWSIAQAHRGGVPVGRFVDKLVDLNGGASIQAGQQITLP
jgi:LysM repeat protein